MPYAYPYAMAFTPTHQISTQVKTYGRIWSDALDGALYNHHQNSNWCNIVWNNAVLLSSTVAETFIIYAMVHRNCAGSSCWPRTIQRDFVVFLLICLPCGCRNACIYTILIYLNTLLYIFLYLSTLPHPQWPQRVVKALSMQCSVLTRVCPSLKAWQTAQELSKSTHVLHVTFSIESHISE